MGAEIAGPQLIAAAEKGRHAHGLGVVGAGHHHPRRPTGHVRRADNATGQEEVVDIATVHATIGDRVDPLGVPLFTARFVAVDTVRRM